MHHFHLIQTWNNWSFSLSLTIAKRTAPAWPALAQIINPGLTSALPTILTYQSYCWPPTGCLIKIGVKSTQGVRTIHSTLMSTKSLYLWLIFVSDIPPNYPSQPVSSSSRAEWTQSIHQGVDNCHELDQALPHNFHGHHTLHYSHQHDSPRFPSPQF